MKIFYFNYISIFVLVYLLDRKKCTKKKKCASNSWALERICLATINGINVFNKF